ncbi:transporter substrate-binding domain-containing protein [Arcobacter sp. CECT 8983]|uniref:transporter substrate-binding domain-containing protein n=1 Tax=Arcobacter sp. CECT 8983 TaxID=2044508 RepID=UPI00215A0673|nr:transporter substrate-binding domain-containing protein [Arcobacter sp. CECT 8983]
MIKRNGILFTGKKLVLALMVFATMNLLADDINLWKKSTLNEIVKRGELRACLDPGYMPFEMKDKRGRIIGYDIDYGKKMAKEMGVKFTPVATAFDGIIASLLTGKCDIIMSAMTITQQRNLKINFANPYTVLGQTVLISKELEGKVTEASQLDKKGYTIVTKLGVTGEIVAKKFFKNAKVVTFETEPDALSEVLNGKADAFIYDKPYNILFMTDKGKGKLVHLDTPLTYEPLGWAIRKGDPDFLNWLNNFLRQTQEDKLVDFHGKLNKKWLQDTDWLKRVQ